MRASILPRHALTERRFRFSGHVSTPQLSNLSRFWLVFSAPKVPKFRAKQPITAAFTGGRSGHFGTHLGATGGTQTHSRRTGRKLGQLPCTRQALVRVPESNTKYGGKGRKTGGYPTPSVEPSISESSGIRKRKKLFSGARFRLRPAVHRATIYCAVDVLGGLLWTDSREATGTSGQTCPQTDGLPLR
jgi:hypothetical protein